MLACCVYIDDYPFSASHVSTKGDAVCIALKADIARVSGASYDPNKSGSTDELLRSNLKACADQSATKLGADEPLRFPNDLAVSDFGTCLVMIHYFYRSGRAPLNCEDPKSYKTLQVGRFDHIAAAVIFDGIRKSPSPTSNLVPTESGYFLPTPEKLLLQQILQNVGMYFLPTGVAPSGPSHISEPTIRDSVLDSTCPPENPALDYAYAWLESRFGTGQALVKALLSLPNGEFFFFSTDGVRKKHKTKHCPLHTYTHMYTYTS